MQAWAAEPKLQRQACWSLLTLAASDTAAADITRKGGVSAIIAAMTNCSDDASVQHFGCWSLANLAWDLNAVRLTARAQGGVEVIQTALRRFPRHAGIAEKGRLALSKIALAK